MAPARLGPRLQGPEASGSLHGGSQPGGTTSTPAPGLPELWPSAPGDLSRPTAHQHLIPAGFVHLYLCGFLLHFLLCKHFLSKLNPHSPQRTGGENEAQSWRELGAGSCALPPGAASAPGFCHRPRAALPTALGELESRLLRALRAPFLNPACVRVMLFGSGSRDRDDADEGTLTPEHRPGWPSGGCCF